MNAKKNFFLLQKKFGVILTKINEQKKKVQKIIAQTYVN